MGVMVFGQVINVLNMNYLTKNHRPHLGFGQVGLDRAPSGVKSYL